MELKRLTTEEPRGMVQSMHNAVFIKNREVYVREGDVDISLVEFIRKHDKEIYGIDHDDSYCNAEEFTELMDDDRLTCIIYHMLVGFAEVREKLKYYEDNGFIGEIQRS